MESTNGAGNALTRKLGPLPVFAWAGIIAGSVYVYRWYSNRSAAIPTPIADTFTPGVLDNLGTDTGAGGPYAGTGTLTGNPPITTNEQWARIAADTLDAQGSDPTLVSNALRHYLDGVPLSTAENAVKNRAITLYGVPPEGVLASTPVPKVGATTRRYVVVSGDTLSGIANKLHLTWAQIYTPNAPKLKNTHHLVPGTALYYFG